MERGRHPKQVALRLALVVAIGALVGLALASVGAPLPWLLGPLLTTAAVVLAGWQLPVPIQIRFTGQLLVATAVGLNVTPSAMRVIVAQLPLMLFCAGAAICFAMGLALILSRVTKLDTATALFSTLPGGPVEMATLSQEYGGHAALVALGQTLRVAAVVTIVPPVLILLGTSFRDITRDSVELNVAGLFMALALALIASLAVKRLGVANAYFLGPLFGVGLASALGAPLGPMPGYVIAGAQIALGLSLGVMFSVSSGTFSRSLIYATVSAILSLIVFGFVLSVVLSAAVGGSFAMFALANAPGSVAEMAVTAKGMSVDSALVTCYHLSRIAIVVPFASVIFRVLQRVDLRLRKVGGS